MKKFLSMLIVGLFTGLSFVSANTVDGFTSDSDITVVSFDGNTIQVPDGYSKNIYLCIASDDLPFSLYNITDYDYTIESLDFVSNNTCYNAKYKTTSIFLSIKDSNGNNKSSVGNLYLSKSPITAPSSGNVGNEGGSIVGNTNSVSQGVINGVNSFVAGFGGLVPMLLLFGLFIFVVCWGWDIVWSWLKHIFVVDKPRGDDIYNCELSLNKYNQFEHHIIGQHDRGDYVDIPGVGLVGKDELPYYVDENLEFDVKKYKQDHETFDTRDPGIAGDDYYKRSENIEEEAYYYEKYL